MDLPWLLTLPSPLLLGGKAASSPCALQGLHLVRGPAGESWILGLCHSNYGGTFCSRKESAAIFWVSPAEKVCVKPWEWVLPFSLSPVLGSSVLLCPFQTTSGQSSPVVLKCGSTLQVNLVKSATIFGCCWWALSKEPRSCSGQDVLRAFLVSTSETFIRGGNGASGLQKCLDLANGQWKIHTTCDVVATPVNLCLEAL